MEEINNQEEIVKEQIQYILNTLREIGYNKYIEEESLIYDINELLKKYIIDMDFDYIMEELSYYINNIEKIQYFVLNETTKDQQYILED